MTTADDTSIVKRRLIASAAALAIVASGILAVGLYFQDTEAANASDQEILRQETRVEWIEHDRLQRN